MKFGPGRSVSDCWHYDCDLARSMRSTLGEAKKSAGLCVWEVQECASNGADEVATRDTHSGAIDSKLWQRLPWDVNPRLFRVMGYTTRGDMRRNWLVWKRCSSKRTLPRSLLDTDHVYLPGSSFCRGPKDRDVTAQCPLLRTIGLTTYMLDAVFPLVSRSQSRDNEHVITCFDGGVEHAPSDA